MAHRNSFRSSCEIVEIEEDELNSEEHYRGSLCPKSDLRAEGKDRRSHASNLGRISSLEDDLNQLFEIFNRRNSSQGMGHSPQNGVGLSKKNSSKKLVRASSSSAHAFGISERVNLKQAFRGLCISQASEMAAAKRSAKSGGSSEAGRITTSYKNVAAGEDNISVVSHDEGKGGLLEISLKPEEPTPLNNGTRASSKGMERVLESYESRTEMPKLEVLSKERIALPESNATTGNTIVRTGQGALVQNEKAFVPSEPRNQPLVETSPDEMLYSLSTLSSATVSDNLLRTSKSGPVENPMFSTLNERASQVSLTGLPQKDEHAPVPSAQLYYDGKKTEEMANSVPPRKKAVLASSAPGNQTSMLHKEDHPDATSSQQTDRVSSTWEPTRSCPAPYKSVNKGSPAKSAKLEDKASAVKGGQKCSLQIVPPAGLAKGNNVKKPMRSVSRLVKPVIKTKNFVKRKSSKTTTLAHSPKDTHSEFNNALYPGSNHIVCPRCHCVLNEEWEEVEENSLLSTGASPSVELAPLSPAVSPGTELSPLSAVASPAEMSPDNVFSDSGTPTYNVNNTSKVKEAIEVRGDFKSRDKGEFTQSSKGSPDECSSSTSISEESNLGRSSFCDRPHMSKDARWQAIRQIRMQHGTVSLRHFNLLKKLGCGDIGTVYLAELIGTSCLFAIKVMDNEFLARRKKIARAQTEKEILRMLDHPFLPTLYCQFTTDNLSCLVMEYCPGGDLHVLRQRQPGRCFTEQAARFYVAEVLLALEYLHMLGVVYRDLKPENILVREDGHIMLSDFDLSLRCAVSPTLFVSPSTTETTKTMSGPFKDSGCVQPFCVQQPSCQVSCFGPRILRGRNKPQKLKAEPADLLKPLLQLVAEPTTARSNSFVGTHEYLAPEIIKGEGHGSAVDWWTFGIFLYELLYGRTPFRGSGNEETLANVVLHNLKFPDSPLVSLQARDLITGLLVKEPEGRLGSERGAAEIKQHAFFEGLNWALIRCTVPPELPEFHRSYGVAKGSLHEKGNGNSSNSSKYYECNASTGEQLEFEVF